MKQQLLTLALLFIFLSSIGQEQSAKEMYLEAESYFLYEEFTEALPLYLKLSKADPENDNLNYKIGVCYLNISYDKERSIGYLEKAIKNINPKYNAGSQKERQAPLDAMFYLGNAYRINNQLDKAQKTYFDFKRQIDPEVFDEELVNEQLRTLERAKKYMAKPIYYKYKNLGEPINSRFEEKNAVVSADEKTIVYNVKLQFYDALYYSTYSNGSWAAPVNIIPDLGVDGDVYATSISADGKELFIYRSDNFDGNLYVSRFNNGRWSPIKRLNDNINTKYWESHASVSSDGTTLYFTSNRKGSYGGLDIYKATRSDVSRDDWGNVSNLGESVNSQFNEETPFISEDGEVLYFSSYGHFNMGGYDIFYSTLLGNDKWSTPLNMGYPLNTTDDDVFYCPVGNGSFAYVCRYYAENFGKLDVYKVEVFSDQHPRKFILKGLVGLPADYINSTLIAKIVNKKSKDTLRINIDPNKAAYEAELKAGDYKLIIEGDGIQKATDEFKIEGTQDNDEVNLNTALKSVPKTQKALEKVEPKIGVIEFSKSFYKVFDNKPIEIELNLPSGSQVSVDIKTDSLSKRTDKFITKTDNSTYAYTPVVGKNVLKFKASTPDNKLSEGEVIVYFEQLADSVSETELAKLLEEKQRQLLYDKAMLAAMASGTLQSTILGTDIIKENLSSLEEFGDYLKNQAPYNNYKPVQVDSLITAYKQQQPSNAQMLIDALSFSAPSTLLPLLNELNKSNNKNSVNEAIDYLLKNSTNNEDAIRNLMAITSRLADAGNVFYYLTELRKVTSGDLKSTLDTLNLNNNKISTPEELLDYLLEKSKSQGYSNDEVFEAFVTIPAFTSSPAILLSTITGLAQGNLADFLSKFNLNEKQIKTTTELGMLLLERAKQDGINQKEIIKLIIKANSQFFFKQLADDLNNFSIGQLKDLVEKIDYSKDKITASPELLNYILSQCVDCGLEGELIKTFSNIASKNLIKANANIKAPKKGWQFSIFTKGLLAIFLVLLVAILIFAVRRKRQE